MALRTAAKSVAGGPLAGIIAAAARALPSANAVTVLTYHRVAPRQRDDLLFPAMVSADPTSFAAQLDVVQRNASVLSMEELLQVAAGRRLDRPSVAITFDDAYRDVAEHAWPILRERGLPATMFVPTAFPDSERSFWWDRLHAALTTTRRHEITIVGRRLRLRSPAERARAMSGLRSRVKSLAHDAAMAEVDEWVGRLGGVEPGPAVLSWEEIRRLADEGMTIASHTAMHPLLTRVPLETIRAEVKAGIGAVAERLGASVPVFAYPSGAHDRDVVDVVRKFGITLAFTTRRGSIRPDRADWLRLPRVNIGGATTARLLEAELALLPRIAIPPSD